MWMCKLELVYFSCVSAGQGCVCVGERLMAISLHLAVKIN